MLGPHEPLISAVVYAVLLSRTGGVSCLRSVSFCSVHSRIIAAARAAVSEYWISVISSTSKIAVALSIG